MAKNKQQKKKERERRVAKKKLAAATKRRTQEKTTIDSSRTVSNKTPFTKTSVPKTDHVVTSKKSTFTQRRSGG